MNKKSNTLDINYKNTKKPEAPYMVTSQYSAKNYNSNTRNWDAMTFFLFPQNQTYSDLTNYPPTGTYSYGHICLFI